MIAAIEAGAGCRAAASRFAVSVWCSGSTSISMLGVTPGSHRMSAGCESEQHVACLPAGQPIPRVDEDHPARNRRSRRIERAAVRLDAVDGDERLAVS
jgi:hypothetical protein